KPVIYDAQATGGSETINGKSCKLWNMTRDGVLSQQLCVVPMSAMPGADEAVAMFKNMSATFEKFGQAARGMFDNSLRESSAAYAKINGFPIVTRAYKDGKLAPEQTVVKTWKQQSIDAAKFEIPADYTKQEMPKIGERK
ncbi:MAG TPA: DUF4412 domain-containing protein, partial [Steroidobacteraceae bacterium]|nr:DUF4412 domain-containing protein [Steroidobacteraceae bacterium]